MDGGILLIAGALWIASRFNSSRATNGETFPDWPVTGDPYVPDDPAPIEEPPSVSRLDAFLWMIGAAETTRAAMLDGSAFTTFYGMSQFSDLSDHPVLTGEKRGVPLPDAMCRAAGFGPGCVSTAAGAWQINVPTWRDVRRAGSWGDALPDFSPESQREAARRVLILAGGYEHALIGDFDAALAAASTRWASLQGSTAGQRPKSRETLFALYSEALGVA